jgi:hypothetical protein
MIYSCYPDGGVISAFSETIFGSSQIHVKCLETRRTTLLSLG